MLPKIAMLHKHEWDISSALARNALLSTIIQNFTAINSLRTKY